MTKCDLEVTGQQPTALARQAEEGARIQLELASKQQVVRGEEREKSGRRILMNSRADFHQPLGLIRTTGPLPPITEG